MRSDFFLNNDLNNCCTYMLVLTFVRVIRLPRETLERGMCQVTTKRNKKKVSERSNHGRSFK